jgi:2-polyprenyl-6-methoxyphenol hydroxylase-like FAD-dependent oxidoreductase
MRDTEMIKSFGNRAIVIGSGVAGLAAAKAVSSHFDEVIILERDSLPADASPRSGAPQSFHAHVLLDGGLRALEELFPGFERYLAMSGAVKVNSPGEIREEVEYIGAFPQRDLGIYLYCMTRPLLESVIRERTLAQPNVSLRQRCRVRTILMNPDSRRATGVTFEDQDGKSTALAADLVVDASGRGILTRDLLRSLSEPEPEETTIGIKLNYATAIFAIPPGRPADWESVYIRANPPNAATAGVIMPIEGDRWMITLGSYHDEPPPADLSGFLAFAKRLSSLTLYEAAREAELLSPIHRFGLAESSWRHYERVKLPQALITIGDAVCQFNPIYGQGMTVAAKEASVLARLLRSAAEQDKSIADIGAEFLASVTPIIGEVWAMSAVPDFAFPETAGDRPADLEASLRYGMALEQAAVADAMVHKLILEVRHLIRSSEDLRDPDIMQHVTAHMV